ncbi:MAG: hypothetical protein RLO08_05785 [Parvibaculaceae bacterium]
MSSSLQVPKSVLDLDFSVKDTGKPSDDWCRSVDEWVKVSETVM